MVELKEVIGVKVEKQKIMGGQGYMVSPVDYNVILPGTTFHMAKSQTGLEYGNLEKLCAHFSKF